MDVQWGSGATQPELARPGHRVTGVDLSAEAIQHARRTAVGLDIELVHTDMRDVPLRLPRRRRQTAVPVRRAKSRRPGNRFAVGWRSKVMVIAAVGLR